MKHYISVENFIPEHDKIDLYKEEHLEEIDSLMERFLLVYLGFSGVLAIFYQDVVQIYWVLPSLGSFTLYHLLKRFVVQQDARYLLTAVLAVMSVMYVIQLNGAFYMQIVPIITLAVLVFYQNWRILTFYYSLIGIYNLTWFVIYQWTESEFAKKYFLNVDSLDAQVVFFGVLLGTAQLSVSVFFANYLNKQTEKDARNTIYLNEQLNFAGNLEFANQIADGNLEQDFIPAENDVMGEALLNMRNSLKDFVENERLNKWKSDGVAQISDVLVSSESIEDLSQRVLNKVVAYLGAQQGLFYILHQDSFKHEPYLKASAAYAYDEASNINKKIVLGEGLVGQVAQTRNAIYLKNPPDTFFKIKSAIGESSPKGLILVPLHVREDLVGVMEIALLRPLSEQEQQLIKDVAGRIAATMIALRSQEENKRLLQESQEYAEQIASQEEEMRQNVEELTSTQEELAKQMRESEYIKNETIAQLEALNLSTLILQLNTKGIITSANDRLSESIRRYEDNLIQEPFETLIEDEQMSKWKDVWKQVQLGEIGHIIFKTKRGDRGFTWIDLTIAPVRNQDREIYKYICIGHNITRQIKQDDRLKKLLKEAETAKKMALEAGKQSKEQLTAIDNSTALVHIGADAVIVDANQNFLDIIGYEDKESLIGKKHQELVLEGEKNYQLYNDLWEHLRAGEVVEGTFERKDKDGNSVWIRGGYTPIMDKKGKLQKVIKLCYNVTTSKKQQIELEQVLEQMTAQEEEMKMSLEHLNQTQEELALKTQEFKDFHDYIERFNIIIDFDKDGNILYVNELFEQTTGYKKEEVVGKKYSDYEKLENNESFEHLWKDAVEGDYTERIIEQKGKNKQTVWLKTFYIPITNAKGEIIKVTAVSDDVSTQKNQEQLIQENIQQLQNSQLEILNAKTAVEQREKFLQSLLSILDEVPALIGRAVLGDKLEIIYVNEYGKELLGYEADYIKKNGFEGFIHKDDLPKLAQTTKEELNKKEYFAATFRVRTKGRRIKTVWEYAQKVEFDGKECIDFFIIDPQIVSKNDLAD